MSNLQQTIKELYNGEIPDGEVELATNNLLELFRIFSQVDLRLQNKANSHEKAQQSSGKAAKPRTKNQRKTKSNNSQNENNRGAN